VILKFAYIILGIGTIASAQSDQKKPESLLNYSITGQSNSSSPAENATSAMEHVEVQRLLLDVAASPRDLQYVEAALRGSGVSLDEMLSNGSLRLENGRYWLNFGLLTRADQETIVRVAGNYSQRLADAVLSHRTEIEALLRSYNLEGVDRKAVAFVVLGCFSLDWDGLRFATQNGYRATTPARTSGQFFFMAEERGGPPLKKVYWGSSNNTHGKYGFTSFGDHFSPRSSLWTIRHDGPPELRAIPIQELAEQVGAVMLALREGPLSAAQLPARNRDSLLAGLVAIGYVRRDAEQYRAAIPVLAMRDQEMIAGLKRIGRDAINEWFAANYTEFLSAMLDISPVRNRVPFPVAFDQLWHYLFGIANQKLVEGGLFADPYAPNTPLQGYVPVVYAKGLQVWK
jgi:hypothetical protein